MGILVPLYLAGLTALSLPLVFHLVRRTPRGRQAFSSLMFLAPTPPKLTRRSRLDQILLLLLRLAALALIVMAFSRPFLREAASLTFGDLTGKRLALVIDTSASMKRGDLWSQAIVLAEEELADLNPHDDVALFAFGDKLATVIDFQKEGAPPIADKPQVVRHRLKELRADWSATDLGSALATVAAELDSLSDASQSSLDPLIVVISDFQAGSRIEALQSFEWPTRVPVVTRNVSLKQTTNAHAHVLPTEPGDESTDVRVRVTNSSDSKGDNFRIGWGPGPGAESRSAASRSETATLGETGSMKESGVAVYVPAGQSRMIRLPRVSNELTVDRVLLSGDEQSFDNLCFVVPPRQLEMTVPYLGADAADDPDGLSYYLKLAVANDPFRQVEVRPLDDMKLLGLPGDLAPKLIVVGQALTDEWQAAVRSHLEQGRVVLFVLRDDETTKSAALLLGDVELASVTSDAAAQASGKNDRYVLLGDIDFTHPLFRPFAGPRYGDFTKIHFWRHRRVQLKPDSQSRVIARFDNNDPAVLDRAIGRGRLLVLASGWQPNDSQLAVSSKFVPLIGSLLDLAAGDADVSASVVVHEPVKLPAAEGNEPFVVYVPNDGADKPAREVRLAAGQTSFDETDRPGIYTAKRGSQEFRFAVNLAASECHTAPLELEQLEQRGVRFGSAPTRAERIERIRQQRDTELESRQKLWRWLIVIALAILLFETWWASRAERQALAEG